jgi:hypothetical protein
VLIENAIKSAGTYAGVAAGSAIAPGWGTIVGGAAGLVTGSLAARWVPQKSDDILESVHAKLSTEGRPILADLSPQAMVAMNNGHLAPHRAHRTDGTLVPIYTLSGRTPGNTYFDDLRGPVAMWGIARTEGRPGTEAIGLVMTDLLLAIRHLEHLGMGNAWGAPFSGLAHVDMVRRSLIGWSPGTNIDIGAIEVGIPRIGVQYDRDRSSGGFDSDGFVGFGSGHGFRLVSGSNEFFSHEKSWDVGGQHRRGSWYRVYDDRYDFAGGPRFDSWSWSHHGYIHHNVGTGRWIHRHLLGSAGPHVGPERFSQWEPEEAP